MSVGRCWSALWGLYVVVALVGCDKAREQDPSPGSSAGGTGASGGAPGDPSSARRRKRTRARPRARPRTRPTTPPRPAGVDLRRPRWPAGYVLRKTVGVPPEQLVGFGRRLGGRLAALNNYFIQRGAQRLQVNVFECADPAAAGRVYHTLTGGQFNRRLRFAVSGRFVVELVGGDPEAQYRFKRDQGLLDRAPRRYRVTARCGLLRSGDAADVNEVFNLVLQPRPTDGAWKARLRRLTRGLAFGQELTLRAAPTAAGRPVYRLTPAPRRARTEGVATHYVFGPVPKVHGLPYVDLVAEVHTVGWTPLPTAHAPRAALTAPTRAWPTKDPAVQARVRALVVGQVTPMARLAVVHGWVHRNVRRGGRTGSRDGALKVLQRGFGQCADSADVLITLARAAGLPARLVAGWLEGGGGHVWAEVHIPKVGWVPVDATAPWIGVSGDYIPLMISEDGLLPLMHLRMPKIERLR